MKLPAGSEKLGIAILGVVSVLMVARMVAQFKGTPIADAHLSPASTPERGRPAGKAPSGVADDLARYDPVVRLEALKELDSRPLPPAERSPFDYVGGGPQPVVAAPPPSPVPAAPPPPPPPLPLKAMGYNELPGGGKEAVVSYEDNMQLVHEGETVGTRFKVIKITPAALTVQDETDHTTHELPFPQ